MGICLSTSAVAAAPQTQPYTKPAATTPVQKSNVIIIPQETQAQPAVPVIPEENEDTATKDTATEDTNNFISIGATAGILPSPQPTALLVKEKLFSGDSFHIKQLPNREPVVMEVDNEAEAVGATGLEVEVEDIPLEEDQEFRRTILRPESNLSPTGDEWIVPIVLFPEPIVKVKENVGDNEKHMDNQQETPTTVPMEVKEEQSPVSMEHPVHQQQQQPSTEHVADKDALTKKVLEKI